MKKLLVFVLVAFSATAVMAQSSQLATLNHGGSITTYYGANALSQAHSAAQNGDVITLSAGSFNGVNITKAVTLRGAGMGMDSVKTVQPTIINSDFTINVPAAENAQLIMEGIFHNGAISYSAASRPMFIKCRFLDFYANLNGILTEATFLHCIFFSQGNIYGSGSCVNCIINHMNSDGFTFTNCDILDIYTSTHCNYYNCILGVESWFVFDNTNTAYHCVAVQNELQSLEEFNAFADLFNSKNTMLNDPYMLSDLFEKECYNTAEMTLYNDAWFELSSLGKQYKGEDGKEVGIYGGTMPFDPRTTTPQITKCNVAGKSTADGKLSVDIEVSGLE